MRTTVIIVVVLVLLTGISSVSSIAIHSAAQNLGKQLTIVESSLQKQEWDRAQASLNSTQAHWDKTKNILTIILDHHETDTIEISMKRLAEYIRARAAADSLAEVTTLQTLIRHITDKEDLTLTNVF